MSELKFIITGTVGVGKTTAINILSDVPTVSTDELTTDELAETKNTTTVAFDFGEVRLDDQTKVCLYGTPGQERFRHMWEILAEGALGLIVLVDNSRPDPVKDMCIYLDNFSELVEKTGVVVGVTRVSKTDTLSLEKYYDYFETQGASYPVIEADPRQRDDMILLMDALMAVVEYV